MTIVCGDFDHKKHILAADKCLSSRICLLSKYKGV